MCVFVSVVHPCLCLCLCRPFVATNDELFSLVVWCGDVCYP